MRIDKGYPTGGQGIHMGGLRLWMPSENALKIIQIVADNKEYITVLRNLRMTQGGRQQLQGSQRTNE